MDEPELLLPQRAAAYLGIPELVLHQLIAARKVRTVLFRGVARVPVYELERYGAGDRPADLPQATSSGRPPGNR